MRNKLKNSSQKTPYLKIDVNIHPFSTKSLIRMIAFCSQIQNLKRLKKERVIKSTRESNYLT